MEKFLHIYIYILEIRLEFIENVKNCFLSLEFIEHRRYITIGTIIFVVNSCVNTKYTYRLLVVSMFIEIKTQI